MSEPDLSGQTQAWLKEAKEGGEPEFSRLYEYVAPAVFAWATLRLRRDGRTEIDAQDLVQEVWLRAWRSLPDFEEETTPFRRWIFRVAKLVMLELLRDGSRRRQAELGTDTKRAVVGDVVDPGTAISRRVQRDESLQLFMDRVA
ncbi:MAG: sigma-70 family RNA polymerase sigma factor, partial [Planctomycetota bacterium]